MTFEAFWESYPRKDGKQYAEKCYARAVKKHGAATILAGETKFTARMKAEGREKQHIMQASRFLNQAVFLDDFAEMAKPRLGNQDTGLLPDKDRTRRWVGGIAYTYVDALGFRQRKRSGMAISAEEAEAMRLWNLG